MKKKILFIGLFICLFISSCTNSDIIKSNEELGPEVAATIRGLSIENTSDSEITRSAVDGSVVATACTQLAPDLYMTGELIDETSSSRAITSTPVAANVQILAVSFRSNGDLYKKELFTPSNPVIYLPANETFTIKFYSYNTTTAPDITASASADANGNYPNGTTLNLKTEAAGVNAMWAATTVSVSDTGGTIGDITFCHLFSAARFTVHSTLTSNKVESLESPNLIGAISDAATVDIENGTATYSNVAVPSVSFGTITTDDEYTRSSDYVYGLVPNDNSDSIRIQIPKTKIGTGTYKNKTLAFSLAKLEAGHRYAIRANIKTRAGIWYRIDSEDEENWTYWGESTTLPGTAAKTSFDLKTDEGYTFSAAQMAAAKTYILKSANNSVAVDMSAAEYVNNSLAASLFSGNAKIKTFALPKNVEEIGDSTFYNCAYLTAVTSTKVISKVGKASFMNSKKMESIPDMSDITEIPDQCFAECNKLGPTFPYTSNVTTIGYQAFIRCYALTEIASSTSVTTITGKENFMRCEGLLTFPQFPNVEEYPPYCFAQCKSLTNVIVPEGAKRLMAYSLSSFSSMESIDLPSTLTYMETSSIGNCPILKKVVSRATTAPVYVVNSGGYCPFLTGNGTWPGQNVAVGDKKLYIPSSSTGYTGSSNWYAKMITKYQWTLVEGLP